MARSYRCEVCGWRGSLDPVDAGDAAPCPNCVVYLYPLPWAQTWGAAIVLILATLGFVAAAVYLM